MMYNIVEANPSWRHDQRAREITAIVLILFWLVRCDATHLINFRSIWMAFVLIAGFRRTASSRMAIFVLKLTWWIGVATHVNWQLNGETIVTRWLIPYLSIWMLIGIIHLSCTHRSWCFRCARRRHRIGWTSNCATMMLYKYRTYAKKCQRWK